MIYKGNSFGINIIVDFEKKLLTWNAPGYKWAPFEISNDLIYVDEGIYYDMKYRNVILLNTKFP